jgi:Ca-activated chloride channel family protein
LSFGSPAFLAGLLLVPLLVAAYVQRRRRARRYAVRFTALPSLRAAMAPVPLWRRHLPAALAVASVGALVLALAKPQRTVAVPVEQATIMLVTDHSRSMEAVDVAPDRLTAAQRAAGAFLNQLPAKVRVGVVAFSSGPDAVQAPSQDHEAVRRIVNNQFPDGATATGDALEVALQAISDNRKKGAKPPPSAIVLLSDGKTTTGRDPVAVANEARAAGVPIYTVSLGTDEGTVQGPGFGFEIPVPPDAETLAEIARVSRGRSFRAEDGGKLASIYKNLGSKLGTKKHKREATTAFAAGAMVLLLGAAMTSVRFAGRLP